MLFCPKCGSILTPNAKKCSCGKKLKEPSKLEIVEKFKKEDLNIDIIDPSKEPKKSVVNADCSKCENDKAEFWTVQTRSGDEAETRFYKCSECEHTWREYD